MGWEVGLRRGRLGSLGGRERFGVLRRTWAERRMKGEEDWFASEEGPTRMVEGVERFEEGRLGKRKGVWRFWR